MTQDGIWRGGKCPYGYKLVHKGRKGKKNKELYDLEIDPVAGCQIQQIFEMAGKQGLGTTRIANHMNEHFPDPKKVWTRATVMTILKNLVYTGRMHMNDVISEPIEALILSQSATSFTEKFEQARYPLPRMTPSRGRHSRLWKEKTSLRRASPTFRRLPVPHDCWAKQVRRESTAFNAFAAGLCVMKLWVECRPFVTGGIGGDQK